jgi:site-specific recombinase XerD
MTDLIVVPQAAHWQRLKRLVLDSVSSPITRRVYNLGLDEFFEWYGREPRPGFTKATVCAWRVALEAPGLGTVSINVRITAVRKLAMEAADNGLLAPELAAGITRVKWVASKGVRMWNWLSIQQAQKLLNAPDATTTKGLRDRAILAVLLGCGLRRSEVAALTVPHVQQRDGRWCIVDLVGKHGRVRTIPMPTWVKVAMDAWTSAAGVTDGFVFRPVNRAGQAQGVGLSEKVVWQLLRGYAAAAGVPGIAPHDCRRYAESRIMPNRQRCDHARKALDTARCGIVLAMPVLRFGRWDPMRQDRAFPNTIEHLWSKPRWAARFDCVGKSGADNA